MTPRSLLVIGATALLGWSGLLGCATDPLAGEPAEIVVRLAPRD